MVSKLSNYYKATQMMALEKLSALNPLKKKQNLKIMNKTDFVKQNIENTSGFLKMFSPRFLLKKECINTSRFNELSSLSDRFKNIKKIYSNTKLELSDPKLSQGNKSVKQL